MPEARVIPPRNQVLVVASLERLEPRILTAAAQGLGRGLLYAVSVAQRKYLAGPRPQRLDVRTRRLRNSVVSKVDATPDGVLGRIGTNLSYAGYHEFGMHGRVTVKAHSRVTAIHDSMGNAIDTRRRWKDRNRNVIGLRDNYREAWLRSGRKGFVQVQSVREHTRNVNYDGRPYLRPALTDAMPRILSEVKNALEAAATPQNPT